MAKKRAAAEETSKPAPKRTKTTTASEVSATTAKKATKASKSSKVEKSTKTAKPKSKPTQKPAPTKAEPKQLKATKKRPSPDATESKAKRVKVDADAPKKPIRKPKAAKVQTAVKSPIEIIKKLPSINSVPTKKLIILACGEGSAGELGLGPRNSVDVKRPRLNALLDANTVGVVQIATGGMHCVALTHDNKILTWGVNDQCALGRNTDWEGGLRDIDSKSDDSDNSDDSDDSDDTGLNPKESTPTSLADDAFPAGTKFVQVVAGDSCSFALTDTGLVYGWGTFRVSLL
jgi:regulator of chromosome condensation